MDAAAAGNRSLTSKRRLLVVSFYLLTHSKFNSLTFSTQYVLILFRESASSVGPNLTFPDQYFVFNCFSVQFGFFQDSRAVIMFEIFSYIIYKCIL